jgi:hypothetical protein
MYYYAAFPDGTIHAARLPAHVYEALNPAADGTVNPAPGSVHGNYMEFAGYKVKITKYEVSSFVLDSEGNQTFDENGLPIVEIIVKVRVI